MHLLRVFARESFRLEKLNGAKSKYPNFLIRGLETPTITHASPPADMDALDTILSFAGCSAPALKPSTLTRAGFADVVYSAGAHEVPREDFESFLSTVDRCIAAYATTRPAKVKDFCRQWAASVSNAQTAAASAKAGERISPLGQVENISMVASSVADVFKKVNEKWVKYVAEKSPALCQRRKMSMVKY